MIEFDLIVIGSGSGLDVAVAAAEQGMKTAVIEKRTLGGTCLNRGCIPSKMLIHSADVAETIKTAQLFGIKVKGYEVDFLSIIKRVTGVIDHDSHEIEHNLKASENPRLYKVECRFIAHKTLQAGKDVVRADRIVIASGGEPSIPNVKGLKESGFITSDEALRLETQPKEMTILGGGYIAAELAHFYGSLGTKINIVHRNPVLLNKEDEEVAKSYTEIARGKFHVFTDSVPEAVLKDGEIYSMAIRNTKTNASQTLESDKLLVATGRMPVSDKLDVSKTGVKTDERGYVITDQYLETNIDGIFALGDAVGHYLFKHTANLEAQYVYHNLTHPKEKIAVDYSAMPHAIFTSPQIAGVGKTEQELKREGTPYVKGKYNYIDTAMGEALEDKTGFAKFLVEKQTDRILGCHILGTDAATLIHEVLVAMRSGEGTIENITRTVHIHPALNEVVQRAALNLE